MATLPTKPIEKASVYYAGEYAAGIRASTFNLDVWIDLIDEKDEDKQSILNEIRDNIRDAYKSMTGEKPTRVTFDFEWEDI